MTLEQQKRIKQLRDDITNGNVDMDGERAYLIQLETLLPTPTKTLYVDADSLIFYTALSPANVDFCTPMEGTFVGNKISFCMNEAFEATVAGVVAECKRESLLGNMITFKDYILVYTPSTNFRYDLYPNYKIKRLDKEQTKELIDLKKYAKSTGLIVESVEADDVVAYYARRGHPIASGDKDVIYGVEGNNYFYHSAHRKVYKTSKEDADRFVLLQTLAGDSSDDIPGMEGVGLDIEKGVFTGTSVKLLPDNATFEDVLHIYLTRAITKGKAVEHYRKTGLTIKASQSKYDEEGFSYTAYLITDATGSRDKYKQLGGLTKEDALLTRRLVGLDQWKGKRRGLKLWQI